MENILNKGNKVVFVNPVPRVSPYGFDKHVYTIKSSTGEVMTTVNMGRTKGYNRHGSAVEYYMFPIDYDKNRLVTGLDNLIINPFKGMDVYDLKSTYKLNATWSDEILESITTKSKITEQTYYEIKHGTDYDFYTSEVRGGTIFTTKMGADMTNAIKNSQPTFLQKFKYTFKDQANRIESGTQRTDLALKLIKVHPAIAPSKNEANAAQHRFFISEENEELQEKLAKTQFINEAIYKLHLLTTKNSEFNIYRIASLLTTRGEKPLIKGEVAKDTVVYRLNDFIHNSGSRQSSNIEQFLDVYDMFSTKETKELFDVTYILQQAVNYDIITPVDGYYVWHSKYEQANLYKLGTDRNKVIQFFIKEKSKASGDTEITNWYTELEKELLERGARLK